VREDLQAADRLTGADVAPRMTAIRNRQWLGGEMHLKGMIFDMDGTLCNTLPACVGAFQHVFERRLGRRMSVDEVLGMFGPSEEGMIRRLIPAGYEPAVEEYLAEYERLHRELEVAFPGIERALELLRARGIPLGVVTGKGAASAAISFRHLGLAPYFDVVETGSPDGGIKPQGIRRVLARWGLQAHLDGRPVEVAYIGDSPSDMADAARAGVIPLGAGWAATSTVQDPECCGARATFPSVERFCEWIEWEVEAETNGRGMGGAEERRRGGEEERRKDRSR
jgi:pyrophosphatase PpaX